MRTGIRLGGAAAFACATALGIAACGSSGSTSTGAGNTTAQQGGTVTALMGTAPDFLDPQEGYTTQAAEAECRARRPC